MVIIDIKMKFFFRYTVTSVDFFLNDSSEIPSIDNIPYLNLYTSCFNGVSRRIFPKVHITINVFIFNELCIVLPN